MPTEGDCLECVSHPISRDKRMCLLESMGGVLPTMERGSLGLCLGVGTTSLALEVKSTCESSNLNLYSLMFHSNLSDD